MISMAHHSSTIDSMCKIEHSVITTDAVSATRIITTVISTHHNQQHLQHIGEATQIITTIVATHHIS